MRKEKFYSIQSKKAIENAKRTGILRSNKECEMFHDAYEWMKDQMENRINGYSRDEGIIWMYKDKEQAETRYSYMSQKDKYVLVQIKCKTDKVLGSLYYPWSTIITQYSVYGQIREHEVFSSHGIESEEIFDLEEYKNQTVQYTTGCVNYRDIKIIS